MNIAIVKLSSLGDILHAMIVLQFIKKQYPNAHIDWLVDTSFQGILAHHPHIRKVITLDIRTAKKQKSFSLLRKQILKLKSLDSYDYVIDMQGLIKSALITYLLKAKHKVGFDKHSIREPLASRCYTHKIAIDYSENTIARNILLLTHLGIGVCTQDILNKQKYVFYNHDTITLTHSKYIVLIVHSSWASKNYPSEQFVNIANKLPLPCYVTHYDDTEYQVALEMANKCSNITVLPRLNLSELSYVIDYAQLVIGNDSGLSYIAYAMNTPSIILFGSTPANKIYTSDIHHVLKSASTINYRKLNKKDFSIKDICEYEIIKHSQHILSRATLST